MSKKDIIVCDLCGSEIKDISSNSAMIIYEHSYQKWKDKDICKPCCIIIDKARNIGLIEIDYDLLFEQSGFIKDGDVWKSPGFVALYGE